MLRSWSPWENSWKYPSAPRISTIDIVTCGSLGQAPHANWLLYVSIGKSTGQNQSHITTSTVTNDGYGLCLSRSRERVDSPINHPLEDGPEEFGDGTATHSLLERSAQAAQLHTQQSAQPHTISSNAPSEPPLSIQSDTVHTNVDAQQPTGIPHMPEQIGPQTRNYQKKGKKKRILGHPLKLPL